MVLMTNKLEVSQCKRERAAINLTGCLFRLSAVLIENEGEGESALGEGPIRRR